MLHINKYVPKSETIRGRVGMILSLSHNQSWKIGGEKREKVIEKLLYYSLKMCEEITSSVISFTP